MREMRYRNRRPADAVSAAARWTARRGSRTTVASRMGRRRKRDIAVVVNNERTLDGNHLVRHGVKRIKRSPDLPDEGRRPASTTRCS